jgi:hypothetical protein
MRPFRSLSRAAAVSVTCSLILGCSAGDASRVPVASVAQADTFNGSAKTLVDWSGAIANFFTVGQVITGLLQSMNVLDNTDVTKQLQDLAREINANTGAITWFTSENDREMRLGTLLGNVVSTYQLVNAKEPVDWTTVDGDTISAIEWAMQPAAFLAWFEDGRRFGPQTWDVRVGPYAWWQFISSPDADLQYNNPKIAGEDGTYALYSGYGYDWRLGVPALMQLIALRIQLMAMEDPNFTTDHHFDTELRQYHDALVKHLAVMNAGIRCNAVDRSTQMYGHNWIISCADIYTGMDSTSVAHFDHDAFESGQTYNVWYTANVKPYIGVASRSVHDREPWFGVQAMIDTLYLLTHPQTDLTASQGRIATFANHGLCLDVAGAKNANGTPVQLWQCYGGPAQQWFYNREKQRIVDPAFGKCLDVRGINATPGTPAQIWDCLDNDDAQRWTYSPEDHALRNALGNALDIRGAVIQQGTEVWTWPFYGGQGQQWFADP